MGKNHVRSEEMNNVERIIKNTGFLFFRMLLLLIIGLYTSRKVLGGLGVVDYGIVNVVSGFIALFLMISDTLSSAISRFLNVNICKGNSRKLQLIFSTAVIVQIALIIVFLFLAETIGLWFLHHKLIIPEERICASEVVYQLSVLSFAINLLSIPYNAAIISHERMSVFAWISIYEAVMKLIVAFVIYYNPIDRMVWYSLLCLFIGFSVRMIYGSYCTRHFEECRFKFVFDKKVLKEFCEYSGWNFLGSAAVVLRVQGGNVLINVFFGPIVNAAKGLANQVNSMLHSFVFNFMVASNPQITQNYASGNIEYMMRIIEKCSKFSYFIMLVVSLPVLIETKFFLWIWLENVPEHTVAFVRLIILYTLLDTIGMPITTAIMASGKIRRYEVIYSLFEFLNLPITIILFKNGAIPEAIVMINIGILVCNLILKLWYLHRLVRFSVRCFIKGVILKILIVTIIAGISPVVCSHILGYGVMRVIIVSVCSVFCAILCVYSIGCDGGERKYVKSLIGKYCSTIIKT